MMNSQKIIFLILIIFSILSLIFLLPNIDFSNNWFLPLALLFSILLLFTASININVAFLLIIFLFPTILVFHDYKIDISNIFPSLQYHNLPINLSAIFAMLIIVFGILTIAFEWNKIKNIPLKKILSIYTAYILFSFFWSENINISLIGAIYSLVPFFAYILAYCYFKEKKDFLFLIYTILLSSILPLFISIYQFITKNYFFEPDSVLGRIQGPFVHPNLFGIYLFIVLVILISYFLSKENKKFKSNIHLFILLLGLVFIFTLTYSRVSWAAFILFLLLFILIKRYLALIFILISPIILFIVFNIENLKVRIGELFENSVFSSWTARTNIWSISLNEITKKPVQGHGIGMSESIIEKAKTWEGGTSLAHNDFILYSLELGIIGLIFFVGIFASAFYNIANAYKALENKFYNIKILNNKLSLNFKVLSFGILAAFTSLFFVGFFESASREIIAQIFIWTLLGSLSAQK